MPAPFPVRRLLLLSGLALAACHEVMPSSPVEWPSVPTAYPTTFLRGRVTEFGTNTPLAGVTVWYDTTQTLSGSDGNYSITIVNGFQIALVMAKTGYDTARVLMTVRGGDQVMDARLTKQ